MLYTTVIEKCYRLVLYRTVLQTSVMQRRVSWRTLNFEMSCGEKDWGLEKMYVLSGKSEKRSGKNIFLLQSINAAKESTASPLSPASLLL